MTQNPQIRFKKDDGSDYPNWATMSLSDVLDYEQPSKYIVETETYSNEFKIPVLTANKAFILGYTKEINGIYTDIPIIIFDDFTTDFKYVDFDFKVKSSAIKILKPKNRDNLKYIYEYMQILEFKVGSHKRHWISEYSQLQISLPCLEEQQKIAEYFTALDNKIANLDAQLSLMKEYKKANLQQIFSQEMRFKKDDGSDYPDWVTTLLGNVLKESFSGGTPTSTKSEYYGGDIPFIRSGEINSDSTQLFITELGLLNSSAKMVEVGDLLIALYGATSGEVSISKIKGAINQAILCVRPICNTFFLYQWFILNKTNIIHTFLQGGQGNLSSQIIKTLQIPLPCLEEQQKIADYFSAIDDKIRNLEEQVSLMKGYKKAMLQRMLG